MEDSNGTANRGKYVEVIWSDGPKVRIMLAGWPIHCQLHRWSSVHGIMEAPGIHIVTVS